MENNEFDELLRIQRLVTDRLSVEERMDRKIKLMDLINNIVSGPDNTVQIEVIHIEAANEGFSDNEIERLLNELRIDGFIAIDGSVVRLT